MAPLLLESVEQIIGLIEGWPFAILQLLFLDNPDETSIISVSAFFYANGVPVDLAFQLYEACRACLERGGRTMCATYIDGSRRLKMGVGNV